jgi:hypothetical protein
VTPIYTCAQCHRSGMSTIDFADRLPSVPMDAKCARCGGPFPGPQRPEHEVDPRPNPIAYAVAALEARLAALEAAPVLVVDPACERCGGEGHYYDSRTIADLVCPCVRRRGGA